MPRYRGKKPIFSYRDTFSLDITLNVFIYEGLRQFKKTLEKRLEDGGCVGIPSPYYDEDSDSEGLTEWLEDIDKMIYAFDESNEPDITEYDFEFLWVDEVGNKVSLQDVKSRTPYSLEPTNPIEHKRYRDDMEEHEQKVKAGRQLFIDRYDNLWW